MLPLSALLRDEEGWSYEIEAGLAKPRRAEIGQRNDLEVEVLEGVVEGEQRERWRRRQSRARDHDRPDAAPVGCYDDPR